ncbi:MAG TPA: glycosyltransferase [Acetobacteraceae bacterium]|nr:glycosyltransferase [Acetobacteraceae bacterium]
MEAFERAQAEIATGNHDRARRWLDRACRLAPRDQTLALALAGACLGYDDMRAAALFAAISAANDVREAWFGLATAQRRLGDAAGAADAIAEALARHVPDRKRAALCDAIAREAAAPGWCGLSGEGRLTIHAEARGRQSELRLDGRRVAMVAGRLPPGWQDARTLAVTTRHGVHLLGSPINIAAITAVVGCVSSRDGALTGWAWHPGDPDVDPTLTIGAASGGRASGGGRAAGGGKPITIAAKDASVRIDNSGLLARPRGFVVPAEMLKGLTGLLHVRGRDGRDLLGSPLDPQAEQIVGAAAAATLARLYPAARHQAGSQRLAAPPAMPVATIVPRRSAGGSAPRPAVDVVVPVHDGMARTLACLDSVLATVRRPSRVIVLDDASTDPELIRALDALARQGRVRLIRNKRNLGFVASANAGILAAAGRDVVLLNSDTLVTAGWLDDLRAVVYGASDIGTATPLSNDATILSYPDRTGGNAVPDLATTQTLAALARQANRGVAVEIPVAVGFCMYVRRACLDAVGLLRADLFAQGYGEENDFCLRARHLGWRHVAAPGVFVAHVGGHSFGAAARHLQARNEALLERLHPGYAGLIEAHASADPLAGARRRLDLARWRAARARGSQAAILITHSEGGGVERQVASSVDRHRDDGIRAIVLRPSRASDGGKCITVSDGTAADFPNLRYAMPDELPALQHLLAREHPRAIELHHMVGHHPAVLKLIAGLGVPYDVHVHDYAWLCGRVALVGPAQRYCGEPDAVQCEACIADAGSLIDEDITVAALRMRSARLFADARRVITPSEDTAARIRRHFPAACPVVVPHEDDAAIADPPRLAAVAQCRVCVIGAIGIHKGYQVVLDCARDAAVRRLPLEFVVVGHTIDDRRLLATERVFVTGSFAADEAVPLIKAQRATIAWLPSIFPETWCLSLAEAWRAGLSVAAFDIGAPAERIRRTGRGILLPLGLPSHAINNALIAAAGLSRQE